MYILIKNKRTIAFILNESNAFHFLDIQIHLDLSVVPSLLYYNYYISLMKFPRFQIVQILIKKLGFEHIPFPMILSTSTTFTDLENVILKCINISKHPTTSTIHNEQRGIP